MKRRQFFLLLLLLTCFNAVSSAQNRADRNNGVPLNVIKISPIAVFYGGTGGGLGYERFIDLDRKISLSMEAYVGIRNYLIGHYASSRTEEVRAKNYSVMLLPGINLYPRGQRRTLNYSIGTHLLLVGGTENGYKRAFSSNNSYDEFSTGTELRVGTVLSNSISLNISPKFCLGLEGMVGCSFTTKIKSSQKEGTFSDGVSPMGAFSFSLGYRF